IPSPRRDATGAPPAGAGLRPSPPPRRGGARLTPADFPALDRMHRDAMVMATLGDVRTTGRTKAYLRWNLRHWDERGYGLWTFRDRRTGEFVGRGGLRNLRIHGRPETEIPYSLIVPFWGRGLATEIATALVAIAKTLGHGHLVAYTQSDNHASRRVMEKAGFRYERDIFHMSAPFVLYRRSVGAGAS